MAFWRRGLLARYVNIRGVAFSGAWSSSRGCDFLGAWSGSAEAGETRRARGRRGGQRPWPRICAPHSPAAADPPARRAALAAMVGRLSLQDVPELVDTKKKGDGVLDSPDSGLPPSPSPSHWALAAAAGGGSNGGGERAPAPGTLEPDVAATPAAPVSRPAPPSPPASPRSRLPGDPRTRVPDRSGARWAPPPACRGARGRRQEPGAGARRGPASWSRWLENCHRLGGAGAPGEEPPPPLFGVVAPGLPARDSDAFLPRARDVGLPGRAGEPLRPPGSSARTARAVPAGPSRGGSEGPPSPGGSGPSEGCAQGSHVRKETWPVVEGPLGKDRSVVPPPTPAVSPLSCPWP